MEGAFSSAEEALEFALQANQELREDMEIITSKVTSHATIEHIRKTNG